MSYPKIAPCPKCHATDTLSVCTYDSGGRNVECDSCWYLGPAGVSILAAIRLHNEAVAELARAP